MIWNEHWNLEGRHAFLGASKYHWIRYSPEKLAEAYRNQQAILRGTELHALAAQLIKMKLNQPRSNKTFNMYVNDGIGFNMRPEQRLYYSENCFGTADTISFRKNMLRVHDLKTGTAPASMDQLKIYAALFCLEYHVNPFDIQFELRIYQCDEKFICNPEADEIKSVMDTIVNSDKIIEQIKQMEG